MADDTSAFLLGLADDIAGEFLENVKILLAHNSAVLSGCGFTLGESDYFLREGLTVGGKTLGEHEMLLGLAEAVDALRVATAEKSPPSVELLSTLHRHIMRDHRVSPAGGQGGIWKRDQDGIKIRNIERRYERYEFAPAGLAPEFLEGWIDRMKALLNEHIDRHNAPAVYAELHMTFFRIHPFFDGNGRIARLIANLPLMANNLPPLILAAGNSDEYSRSLREFLLGDRLPGDWQPALARPAALAPFVEMCISSYGVSWGMLKDAFERQKFRTVNAARRT